MSAALKPNANMQPSSLKWLGSFPSRWKVEPGLAVLNERQVKNLGMVESTVLSLSYGRVVVKPEEKLRGLVPESFETYQIVEPGHIIIRPTDLQNDQVSLRVGQVKDRGIITSAYLCLETRNGLTDDYAHLLLHAYDLKKVFYGLGSGLRQNLSWLDFRRLPIPVPPPDEQAQIVRFIRHLDQRVNRLIKTKRRLIELLNEQKHAIIHRAVTRGLDPTVPLKHSGVEWLGHVPEHWRVLKVGRLLDLLTGFPFPSSGFSMDESDTPLLRGVNVNPGKLRWESVVRWDWQDTSLAEFSLQPGDLVLGMDRPIVSGGVRLATVTESDVPCLLLQRVCRLRSKDGLVQPFLAALLGGKQFAEYLAPMFTGISVPHISPSQIKQFPVAIPPEHEQIEILGYLNLELADIDGIVSRAQSEIGYIREYRTRLIADVVTGQLDVRHLDLPEVEESLIEAIDAGSDLELDEDTEEAVDAD